MNTTDYRLIYQWTPFFPIGQWWVFALTVVCLLAIFSFWFWIAKREAASSNASWASLVFRALPLIVLCLYCLNPVRISEQRSVQPSEVAVLLDTSVSMSLQDQTPEGPKDVDRYNDVLQKVASSQLLDRLSKQHRVSVFGFQQETEPELLGMMNAQETTPTQDSSTWRNHRPQQETVYRNQRWNQLRLWLLTGVILLPVGALMAILSILIRSLQGAAPVVRAGQDPHHRMPAMSLHAPWLLGGLMLACIGLGAMALGDLLETDWTLTDKFLALSKGQVPEFSADRQLEIDRPSEESMTATSASALLQHLQKEVYPDGTQSRLGDAVAALTRRFAGRSLAGMVLITDGNVNAGTDPLRSVAALHQARVPIRIVGVGQLEPAENAMIVSLDAPNKVLPKSPFKLRGYMRTDHLDGQSCQLQLDLVDPATGETRETLERRSLVARPDSELVAFEFDLQAAVAGRWMYQVKVIPPRPDFSPSDDQQSIEVAVVDRKNHVLLMAGGPSREFRFLRNQLYRDPMVQSDVWLQSMDAGADQEADLILSEFPATLQELDEYDCLIAFDPDWTQLNAQQARDLEQWVSQRGGGLISVAGPVFTPDWSMAPRGDGTVDPIRRLYPVSFFSQGSATSRIGRFGGATPFPLDFTREGTSVDFLNLTNDPLSSREAWQQFEGVYGYYAVNQAKPGAQVLAYFSDPETMMGQSQPIYLAAQFVGKGRVFFQASGEMWRVRQLNDGYFQTYYTKLIRWASQGRLLRDSQQGTLLVDKQRCWVGDSIRLQAQLLDSRGEPWTMPQVTATARLPDGETRQISLDADSDVPGEYAAQLPLRQEGQWRFFLPLPEAQQEGMLQATVSVQLSDLEKRESQQNQKLLEEMAQLSEGKLLDIAELNQDSLDNFLADLPAREQESIQPGQRDSLFSQRWSSWMLTLFVAYFCCGWIYRRMSHLA